MGIDTQFHVKAKIKDPQRVEMLQRKLSLFQHSGAVGNETEEEEVRSELENITDAGIHSEHFPVFQLIPKEMLQNRGKNLKLLPNALGQWHTKVPDDNPVQALAVAKEITIAVYVGARNLGGDLAPVMCPPKILIEDPDVQNKVLWQNMQLVEPWDNDDVSDEIFKINPTFMPREQLSPAQQSINDEMQKVLEVCEFVYYWSKENFCLELQEELRGGFS